MKKIYFLFFIVLSFVCSAQNPADVAQNFGVSPGFSDDVYSIALQPDGKMILGGSFFSYKGVLENKVVRLNSDGSKDSTFSSGTGFNGIVYSIILQPDGKIIVGGSFTFYNGVAENRIVRLNSNGSKDSTFSVGTGFNSEVRSIVLQNDGKIIVGGFFTSYNGITENSILRLNSNGDRDSSFYDGGGFNSGVYAIALQVDGKVIVGGGTFNNGSGSSIFRRLNSNGTVDGDFNTGTSVNDQVQSIVLQPDGKIIIGGIFTLYNGINENRIIRLNVNGTKDTTFSTGTGFSGGVRSIVMQPDGKIIVGGGFTSYKAVVENRIIRLNSNGSKDTGFNSGTGFNNPVFSIALQTDGKIIVGGNFNLYNGLPENRIVLLNSNGVKDTTFNTGMGINGVVQTIAVQPDGKKIIGGSFISYNGVTENYIIRLNSNGTKDTTFNTGIGFNDRVLSVTLQPDGKMIVAGDFTSFNGVTENRVIRLNSNGIKDTTFNSGSGFIAGSVLSIDLQTDGKIIVGGDFYSYNGIVEYNIVRLNNDGTKDTSFITGTGFNFKVQSIVLQPDGKMIVGGDFNSYNGVTENRIVRLNSNGTKDASFSTGSGFNTTVHSIALQIDGKIIVSGFFTSYNGVAENYLVRLNGNGTKDATFSPGTSVNNQVLSIALQPNGKIILGGFFTSYNGITENYIIRLNSNGTKDTAFNTGVGFNSAVHLIALQADGKIVLGGSFTSYKAISSSAYLITLYGDSVLSNEEFLNQNDIALFPNPTQNTLNVVGLNYTVKTVSIYNLHGKLIYENTNGNTAIDVSNLTHGLYFTKITTEKGVFTKKFLKE